MNLTKQDELTCNKFQQAVNFSDFERAGRYLEQIRDPLVRINRRQMLTTTMNNFIKECGRLPKWEKQPVDYRSDYVGRFA